MISLQRMVPKTVEAFEGNEQSCTNLLIWATKWDGDQFQFDVDSFGSGGKLPIVPAIKSFNDLDLSLFPENLFLISIAIPKNLFFQIIIFHGHKSC